MDKYADFMNQIPSRIIREVETYICSDIAIFKPQIFVTGIPMHATDFHIIIPSMPLPDSYLNGKFQSFDKGKIVVLNPGETMLINKAYKTKQYFSLLIKPELMNKIAEEMGFSGDIRFLKLQNPFSSDLMQAIKSLDKEVKRSDSFAMMQDCLSMQIVTLLLREFKTNFSKFPAHSPDRDTYIDLAIDYIHTFFSANITIEDICSEINISSFHFIRTFKEKIGISPHQYLVNVRINKADELLRLGQYSIAEIAILCGFVSMPHFSNTFKRIKGHSPSDYRKLHYLKQQFIVTL